jgi:hypothetical protein
MGVVVPFVSSQHRWWQRWMKSKNGTPRPQVLLAAVCTSIYFVLNLFRWSFDWFSKHLRIYHLAVAQVPTPTQMNLNWLVIGNQQPNLKTNIWQYLVMVYEISQKLRQNLSSSVLALDFLELFSIGLCAEFCAFHSCIDCVEYNFFNIIYISRLRWDD